MSIVISDRAAQEIIKLINGRGWSANMAGLRVGIRAGGCAGFEYTCDLAAKPDKYDRIIEHAGARIFVDQKSALFLTNLEIDYRTPLMGAGFQFNNPESTGNCGCGISFAV